LVFTGTYEHTIDSKNRLAVPADVRNQLLRKQQGDDPVVMYVTLAEGPVMCLYTEEGFEKRADQLDDSELDAEALLDYERLFFSLARRVEMDKNGRIRLPDSLLRMVELSSDVVLIGVKDHLEILDREAWQSHVVETLKTRPQLLMNPRRAMRGKDVTGS